MGGVGERLPLDLESAKNTARLGNNQSQPNPCSAPSRVQIQPLNGWSSPLLIVLLCLSSAALSGCSIYVVNSAATGTLVATPQTVAFGAVSVGQSASIPVSLTNPGATPVQITQIGLAGQSFAVDEADALPVTVAPGGSYNLHVHFNPTAAGIASGQVTIKSDAATQPATVVQLTGSGTTATAPTPSVSGLTCASGAMTGLGTETCTMTLSAAAPSGGFVVSLTSSTEGIALPATVMVPAGATTAAFTAIVSSVGTAQTATLTASSGSVSQTFSLQLNAAVPTLTVSATSLAFGSVQVNYTAAAQSVTLSSTGTTPVTIGSAALTGDGFTVSGAAFPATLNPGQILTLSVQFDPINVGAASGQLTVNSNSSSGAATVISLSGTGSLVPTVLTGLSCAASSFTGASTDTCTVTLGAAAPSGDIVVSLTSSNTAVAAPATVTVPAGATSAGFTATISPVATAQAATLTANAANASKTFALQLSAAVPTLSTSATNLVFGSVQVNTAATAQSVTLSSTGTGPLTISSASLSGAGFTVSGATFPVTLNPGQVATLSVQFDPAAVGAATGQLTLNSNSSTGASTLIALSGTGTPVPATLASLSCTNSGLTGSGTDTCIVSLTAAAPNGGFVVGLASSNAAVAVPASLTVLADTNNATFTATASAVGSSQVATLTATAGILSKTFSLQLNAAVPTLSVNATNVGFGNVEVNSGATQSVVLTSTGTAPVTISSATVTGAGFTLAPVTFPLTLTSGETATLEVSFDPKFAGSANGQVTITNNSSTGNTAVILMSGTGTPPLVELSWNAPSDSTDPVAGYNVYRAPTGTSGFQMLNSSAVPETTYTDNTVRSGQTYDYIVESVDQDGVESIPSNLISLTIP